MRRPPASRRRIRPTLAAAVGCGILGGSLVGLGALGFDKVEVAAAPCAEPSATPPATPAATPAPDATPVGESDDLDESDSGGEVGTDDDLVEGEPVSGALVVQPASLSIPAAATAPRDGGTTVAPEVGPLKPTAGAPCAPEDDPDVIILPGPGAGDDDDAGEDDGEGSTPTPVPTPVPTSVPTDDDDDNAGTPTPKPIVTPTPRPVVVPPLVTPNPVLPAPSTSARGFSTTRPPRTPTPGRTGTITRPEVIARAVSWVTQGVPYSQTRWWTDRNGTYRQDCSGYVAMVWRTDQRINYWTGNLGTISDRIASSAMRPGDILLLPGKHTVIFLGWANQQRTKFHLFEEYRTGYPARFVRNASLSYYLDRGYGAYSYEGIREGVVPNVPLPVATPVPAPVPSTSVVPSMPRTPETETAPAESRTDTVALLSAHTSAGGSTTAPVGMTWTLAQAVAGLPATDWTPGVAEDYTPESPDLVLGDDAAADLGDASLSVDELVAAQATVDRAEQQRLAAAGSSALTLTQNRTSGSGYVLAAGLGLLFIALPLAAGGRRAWTAASASIPPPPGARG